MRFRRLGHNPLDLDPHHWHDAVPPRRFVTDEPTHQRLLLEHLDTIEQVVAFIARRHRLSPDEAEELGGEVRVKLLENDCEVLRAFEHRSSLRTFLTTVVERLFLDDRIAKWGKWRPSSKARRLGTTAVALEKMLTRDGLGLDEAIETLRTNHLVPESESDLRALESMLPVRDPRRVISDVIPEDLPGQSAADVERLALMSDRASTFDRAHTALRAALAALPHQDRLLVQLHYEAGMKIADIARFLRVEQKPLYRRLERLLADLRGDLAAKGVGADDVRECLGDSGTIMIDRPSMGNVRGRPSV